MYTEAINQLRGENYFGLITLSHNANQASVYADLWVTDDATNTIVTPLENELTNAYTRWQAAQAIRDSEAEAQRLTKDDIKKLLATELSKVAPDITAAHIAVQAFISGNVKLTNAHQNTANLLGYDTATQVGYLRAAYLVIALMS